MTLAEEREGLRFVNGNNEEYVVKKYYKSNFVLVIFPDTNTEKYAKWEHIKNGNVKNPIHGTKNPAIMKNRIGLKITNGIGLMMQVIEQKPEYVKIRFDISRSERWVKTDLFMNGEVKDFFNKSVFDIGFLGNHDNNDIMHEKAYIAWQGMLRRCYTDMKKDENSFCYVGIKVDKRWHCYATFQKDIKQLEGYSNWCKNQNWDLDKDLKSGNTKVYSRATCIFTSHSDNVSLRKDGVLLHSSQNL